MPNTLNHVGISVSDLERSVRFYQEMFGMELAGPIFPFEGSEFDQVMALDGPKGRIGYLTHPEIQLELFEFDSPRPVSQDANRPVANHGITHFGIQVEDIDGTYERMRAAGVRFHCPVIDFTGGIRATYGRDPDGNVFELLELKDGAGGAG